MRKLMWFTLGFGAACAFCAYGRLPLLLLIPGLVVLTAYLSGGPRVPKVMLAALGIALGLDEFRELIGPETYQRRAFAYDFGHFADCVEILFHNFLNLKTAL